MKPRALVITGFGINCDYETVHALEMPGVDFTVDACHLNDLVSTPERLCTAHLLVLPGGFSYGDHISSGRVMANRLKTQAGAEILQHIEQGKLILGICNGFQVLVKMGLLPGNPVGSPDPWKQTATLMRNDSGRFEDRWVSLSANPSNQCVFLKDINQTYFPVRHGEGKLVFDQDQLKYVQDHHLDVLWYANAEGQPTSQYPDNPNGSEGMIAGLSDLSGRIFGLMPHPEAYLYPTNHPTWTRGTAPEVGLGLKIFDNAANFIRQELL